MNTKAKVIMDAMRDNRLSSNIILSVMRDESDAFRVTIDALRDKGLSADEIFDILRKMSELMRASDTEEEENKLRNIFLELGIPYNIVGYRYLVKAVVLYHKDPEQGITKCLYPAVAKIFGTTGKCVEGGIGYAIEAAWNRGNIEVFEKYFKNTISTTKGKPANTEFIIMCSEWLNR